MEYNYKHYIITEDDKKYLIDFDKTFKISLVDIIDSKSFKDRWYNSVEIIEGKLKDFPNLYIFQSVKELDNEYSSITFVLKQRVYSKKSENYFPVDFVTLFKKNYLCKKDDKWDLHRVLTHFIHDAEKDKKEEEK